MTLSSKLIKHIVFYWVLLSSASFSFALEECGIWSLEKNIEQIQLRKSKGEIKDLLRCRSDKISFAAYQWQILDLELKKQENPKLYYTFPKPPKKNGRDLVSQARRGRYVGLYNAIRSGNENYVANPAAILALARSLFRAKRYKEAVYYYDLYFKYVNEDDLIEAEKIFSLIVMRDYEEVYNTINILKAYEKSPFMQATIINTEAFLEKSSSTFNVPRNKLVPLLGGKVAASVSSVKDTYSGILSKVQASYSSEIFMNGVIFQNFGASTGSPRNAAHIGGGMNQWILPNLKLKAGLGYYGFRQGFFTFDLGLGIKLPKAMMIYVSAVKTPLGLYYPMEEPGLLLADYRYSVQYKWDEYVKVNLRLANEEGFRFRELYELHLSYPISMSKDKKNYFKVFIPSYFKRRLKISPHYRSFPSELRLEGGLDYKQVVSDLISFSVKLSAGFVNRNHLQDLSARQSVSSFVVNSRVFYRVYKENNIFASIDFDSIGAEDWELKKQERLTWMLGLDFATL